MPLDELTAQLGDEIEDATEETFLLFSTPSTTTSQNLGILDPQASTLTLPIPGLQHDLTIKQSPSILTSHRQGGTTGAVVWKITPRFAAWLVCRRNILFEQGILSSESKVLELGAGIAGVLPVVLGGRVGAYVATDQGYALKLLRENIDANLNVGGEGRSGGKSGQGKRGRRGRENSDGSRVNNVQVLPLDWETDDVRSLLRTSGISDGDVEGVDVVLACDCVYNYALIKPFVQTCVDVCRLRLERREQVEEGHADKQTVCVIAQQLRQPDVFEEWLTEFRRRFRVWRIPDEHLTEDLREGSGFVVHLGVLRSEVM